VRGYFDGAAQVFAAVRSAVILWPCASPRNACANCGAPQLILKKRRGICCATEGRARNCAAHAASKTGLSISTASNIDWRSSLMAVCTRSPMRKDAAKEDYLRSLGIGLLRIPNGLVLEDAEEFVRKVREAMGVMMAEVGPR